MGESMSDRSRNVEDVLAPGTRIEEFEIERELQSGGFGVTYLAQDRSLGRLVAIKEYLPLEWGGRRADGSVGARSSTHAKDYQWGLARFLDEARTLARLDHARIVRVHRVIEAWGTAYMVMEYVEGRNLEEVLKTEGPWPEEQVRALLDLLLPGVALVHEGGLVHRDIKPSNVMLREDGTPVLIDFGSARYAAGAHSRSLTSVLTPGYAPHEQYLTAGEQGPWTDVYALGAVAYRALSGQVPVDASTRVDAIAHAARVKVPARSEHDPDPLVPVAEASAGPVSESFGSAVTAALAVWPEDRPPDVEAWRAQWDDRQTEVELPVVSETDVGDDARDIPGGVVGPAPAGASSGAGSAGARPGSGLSGFGAIRVPGVGRPAAFGAAGLVVAAGVAVAVGIAGWGLDGNGGAGGAGSANAGRPGTAPTGLTNAAPGDPEVSDRGDRAAEAAAAVRDAPVSPSVPPDPPRVESVPPPVAADPPRAVPVPPSVEPNLPRVESAPPSGSPDSPGAAPVSPDPPRASADLPRVESVPPPVAADPPRVESVPPPTVPNPPRVGSVPPPVAADPPRAEPVPPPVEPDSPGAAPVSPSVEPDPPPVETGSAGRGGGDPDPATLAPGARFRDCDGCPELVVVPAGTFRMGSTRGQADETPVHEARLDAFALGRYEVTRGEFQAFVIATGHRSAGCSLVDGGGRLDWNRGASWRRPGFEQEDDHPAVCVSWTDAQAYVRWLSEETGARYGLPSEAEWEYGARADTAGERYWDGASGPQCDYANAGDRALLRGVGGWPLPVVNCADGAARTAPVGSYGANGFGLHDVLGNVWEWTADCWHDDYRGAPADGSAWTRRGDCDRRVLRGGSWETVPAGLRSANRYRNGDNRGAAMVGFRVARSLR